LKEGFWKKDRTFSGLRCKQGRYDFDAPQSDDYMRSRGFLHFSISARLAAYVGAMPAHLPVQQSAKVKLVINLETTKALGITYTTAASGPRQRGYRIVIA